MLVATADEKITYEGWALQRHDCRVLFKWRTDEETRADTAGVEVFVEWPKLNHCHAGPSMIRHDSGTSCLDFYLLCARQWGGVSHLDPKQGNDGQDGRIA